MAKDEHLKLDAEGGAQVTKPQTRYLTTGIALMLSATQAAPDRDAGRGGASGGKPEAARRTVRRDSGLWE